MESKFFDGWKWNPITQQQDGTTIPNERGENDTLDDDGSAVNLAVVFWDDDWRLMSRWQKGVGEESAEWSWTMRTLLRHLRTKFESHYTTNSPMMNDFCHTTFSYLIEITQRVLMDFFPVLPHWDSMNYAFFAKLIRRRTRECFAISLDFLFMFIHTTKSDLLKARNSMTFSSQSLCVCHSGLAISLLSQCTEDLNKRKEGSIVAFINVSRKNWNCIAQRAFWSTMCTLEM